MDAPDLSDHLSSLEHRVEAFSRRFAAVQEALARVVVGQTLVIERLLLALLAGGHVLLEGAPGLGKTLLVQTLAQLLALDEQRVQCTPDLMPSDIVGTSILVEGTDGRRHFEFRPGPIFCHLLLADEINRATPRTQSALLEAMQEHRVTAGGETRPLGPPFFVLATQNPIELEGTYPLPEAQLDRFFFKLDMGLGQLDDLVEILRRTTSGPVAQVDPLVTREELLEMQELVRMVPVAGSLLEYVGRLVLATHPEGAEAPAQVKRYVRYGASPRAAQAVVLGAKARALSRGAIQVDPDDIAACIGPALRHRILLGFEGEAEGVSADAIVRAVQVALPQP